MTNSHVRTAWIVLAACLAGHASVVAAQGLPKAVLACASETDPARRLDCYDRAVAQSAMAPTAAPGRQATPAATAATAATTAATAAEASKAAPATRTPRPVKVARPTYTATVTGVRTAPRAGSSVTLDNGEVWLQNDLDATLALKAGDQVTIRPGALGSTWLVGPSGGAMKVRLAPEP